MPGSETGMRCRVQMPNQRIRSAHTGGLACLSHVPTMQDMELNPAELSVADRYKLLIGGVTPRPIAVVSSLSPQGEPNLAPFSFFNAISSDPMSLMFCPSKHAMNREKDTLLNVRPQDEGGTGQFVVSICSVSWVREMAASAEPFGHGVSEWPHVGLTMHPSVRVAPARVAEAKVSYECETVQIVRLPSDAGPGRAGPGGNIVIGRVVHIYVDDGIINERLHIDPSGLDAVGRLGGVGYCTTREHFELPHGLGALETRVEL